MLPAPGSAPPAPAASRTGSRPPSLWGPGPASPPFQHRQHLPRRSWWLLPSGPGDDSLCCRPRGSPPCASQPWDCTGNEGRSFPLALHSLEQAEAECQEGAERCSLAPAPSASPLACLKAIGGPGLGSVAPACSCCLASPHQPAGPAAAPCCCARAPAPATLGPGLLLSRHEPPRQLWATGGGSGDCSGYCFLKTWLYLLF